MSGWPRRAPRRGALRRVITTARYRVTDAGEQQRIVARHVALLTFIVVSAAALQAPALAAALTYILATGAVAAPWLPNAATEIRAQARHAAVYVAAGAIPFRVVISLLNGATETQLDQWFGADVGHVAASLSGGILPTIYFLSLASIPLAWTSWLTRQWALHRRNDDYEQQLLRARRTDTYQH